MCGSAARFSASGIKNTAVPAFGGTTAESISGAIRIRPLAGALCRARLSVWHRAQRLPQEQDASAAPGRARAGGRRWRRAQQCVSGGAGARCAVGGLLAASAGPVSYTHLRAHETVLDL